MGAAGPSPRDDLRRAAAHLFVADVARPEVAAEDEHHVLRVLRLQPGEVVSVSDGAGSWRLCTLGGRGVLDPAGDVVVEPGPAAPLTIGFAPPKGDRPEWAVARLTELGVDRIQPLVAARSVVRWNDERWERHHSKWLSVIRQAAMQSRQVFLPDVRRPMALSEVLGAPEGEGLALAVPGGPPPGPEIRGVLVGPEGGWAPEEESLARCVVGLGPGVLRTETAALVGAAVCVALRVGIVRPLDISLTDHGK